MVAYKISILRGKNAIQGEQVFAVHDSSIKLIG